MNFEEIRKQSGLSQSQLAHKIGITPSAVNQYEKGKRIPKTTDLPRIAKALNVPVERVLECFTSETKKAE